MTAPSRLDLPYFDLLLEGRASGAPAAKLFERYVHWGYWDEPRRATLDPAAFASAMARLDREVVDAAGVDDGQDVLDAGCGFGGTLAALSARLPRARLTGLNIDARQLVHARANAPAARFVQGDACAMPFEDAAFDRALAVECVFHFPSRLRFLREAARVLRPGGRAALSDFVPASTRGRAGVVGRVLERRIAEGYGAMGDGWRDGDYSRLAAQAGLRLVLDRDITGHTLPTYPLLLDALRRQPEPDARRMVWPTRLLRWLSELRVVRYRVVAFEKPA